MVNGNNEYIYIYIYCDDCVSIMWDDVKLDTATIPSLCSAPNRRRTASLMFFLRLLAILGRMWIVRPEMSSDRAMECSYDVLVIISSIVPVHVLPWGSVLPLMSALSI